MGLINLFLQDPFAFFLLAIPLLYSIIIHELAHGWVAYRMGDPTAKMMGRLSLNPLKHLDPIGTLMLFIFGFGWAKPVPINLSYLRNMRKGLILVSAAGIIANTAFAFLAFLLADLLNPRGSFKLLLYYLAQINIILASFNLIPIPPLDGSKILMGFLPPAQAVSYARLQPYGVLILLLLVMTPLLGSVVLGPMRWLVLQATGSGFF